MRGYINGWRKFGIAAVLIIGGTLLLPWGLNRLLIPEENHIGLSFMGALIEGGIFAVGLLVASQLNRRRFMNTGWNIGLWHPPTLVRFLLQVRTIFPQSQLALYHTTIPQASFRWPSKIIPLETSQWRPEANYLAVHLDSANQLEIWVAKNGEGVRLSYKTTQNSPDCSLPVWAAKHPKKREFERVLDAYNLRQFTLYYAWYCLLFVGVSIGGPNSYELGLRLAQLYLYSIGAYPQWILLSMMMPWILFGSFGGLLLVLIYKIRKMQKLSTEAPSPDLWRQLVQLSNPNNADM